MSYDDRIRIDTPEGVDLELILAGAGSRTGAAVLDGGIRWVIYFVLFFVLGFVAGAFDSPWIFLAVYIPAVFLIEVAYDIAFETLNNGQTIGKRAFGIRVVRIGGQAVDLKTSAVRNLLRLVDGILTGYIVGILTILISKNNQRLGDMAAGTIVVRERLADVAQTAATFEYATPERSGTWDVSAVTADEVATLRRFLERRAYLTLDVRTRLATELATRMRPKIAGIPELIHPEAIIEEIVRTKASRA